MSINIWTDSMQHAALLGKPVLFTNWLIQRDIIPDGWYCYDLRGTHKSPSTRTTLVDHAADYHAGTVLSPIPLKHEGTASRRVNGTFYLLGEEMTLEQFCEEHDLAYPQDNREFVLRPASLDEVGLFYSEEKLDEALGTVGHLRMDFGHGEKEFWHTWWPHNEDRFNTPEFKEVLQRFVDDLRQTGLLKNLGAMDAYCWQHGGSITEDRRSYGYIAETENYRFCLRCTPFPGEYQGYLYCYDLCQQEMYRQEHPVVGRVTFASGEQQEFTDSKALLQAIREELPFRSTTGFRFETLTDDPEVKKAVDDILLDFAGEDNSRRTCNYGLTETGKQALRKAADPSIPHTYAWFVMADTNTPQEIIRQDLTLEEAIQIYQDSNTSEKRLGVIKDGTILKEYLGGQASDGWGEGFEQRPIEVDGGELYVHLWQPDDWSIQTEQERFAPKVAEGLPELCFSTLRTTGQLICIKRGETGYYPSDWDTGDKEGNVELADELNEDLGVTPIQRQAMEIGSMAGWDVPGADPKHYEESYSGQTSCANFEQKQ